MWRIKVIPKRAMHLNQLKFFMATPSLSPDKADHMLLETTPDADLEYIIIVVLFVIDFKYD